MLVRAEANSGVTRASRIILIVIVVSIVGIVGYGSYHYISDHPSILNFLHSSSPQPGSVSTGAQAQSIAVSGAPTTQTTITFATQVNATVLNTTTIFYTVSTSQTYTSSFISTLTISNVNSTTVSANTTSTFLSSNQTSASSAQNWAFVPAYPPNISVSNGQS